MTDTVETQTAHIDLNSSIPLQFVTSADGPLPPLHTRLSGKPKLTICIVSSGSPALEAAKSWMQLAKHENVRWVVMPNGPYMDAGRNRAYFEGLSQTESEWFLTLDDDLEFDPDDLYNLIEWCEFHSLHVAGGMYVSPRETGDYTVAYRHDETGDNYIDLSIDEVDAMDPLHPHTCHVAAIGTGFLLVHRSVLERMTFFYNSPQPWFAELTVQTPHPDNPRDLTLGTHLGEDLTFCRRLWALDIPVHIAPHIRLTHYKRVGFRPPSHPHTR